MFEEIVYILKGYGATLVWNDGMAQPHTFEWKHGAVFALPPNVWYKHTNLQGGESARFCAVTSAPVVINLFHNDDFVFANDFIFTDRFNGDPSHFDGSGIALPGRIWESNFIPDVVSFPLQAWPERGGGGSNAFLEIGNGTLTAHISEFQPGTYKKAHRHGPGAHVIILSGEGYSLMWPEGSEKRRFDWKPGSVIVPPELWFHQHFNTGPTPARYLALRWGSQRFPLLRSYGIDRTVKSGGAQIEYEDEDPDIREMYEASLEMNKVQSRMNGLVSRNG
ncbi:MAG: cupin domain-containing protein [Actinomycetota bacterium]|nr:MAG: cupin domain-containing protein [Actinomycetota bacterium]